MQAAAAPGATIPSRYVYAAMATCLLMMPSVLWIPAQLGAFAQGYGLETRMLGLLGALEVGGYLVGSIVGSFAVLERMKPWVWAGGAILVVANVSLWQFAPALPLVVMRPLASFGAGLGFAYALKVCSKSSNPTRSFGIFTGLMSTVMIIGFQAIGKLLAARTGTPGVTPAEAGAQVAGMIFLLYTITSILGVLVYQFNQPPLARSEGAAGNAGASAGGALSGPVIIALLAILLSFMGQSCIFPFLQTMGTAKGFPVAGIANAMSAWALVGVIGSFTVGAMPQHVPRWVLIGIALLVMLGGYVALYRPPTLLVYTLGCAIGGFYWNYFLPLALGLLARLDPSGRGSGLGGSLSSGGAMLGSLVGGMLVSGTDYSLVGIASVLLTLGGFGCVFLAERRG